MEIVSVGIRVWRRSRCAGRWLGYPLRRCCILMLGVIWCLCLILGGLGWDLDSVESGGGMMEMNDTHGTARFSNTIISKSPSIKSETQNFPQKQLHAEIETNAYPYP